MLQNDPVIHFLETVTYDEVMAVIGMKKLQTEASPEYSHDLFTKCTLFYNWDSERLGYLKQLVNLHYDQTPSGIWQINYFWAIIKNIPEGILNEQFGSLKSIGDGLPKLKISALKYKNRMIMLMIMHNTITHLYPLIHLENDEIKIPELDHINKSVAWRNTESRTIKFLIETVNIYLSETLFYSPTPDLKAKITNGMCGSVEISAGTVLNTTRIIGENGIIDLTNSQLKSI